MRLIIAGTRDLGSHVAREAVIRAMSDWKHEHGQPTEVLSGNSGHVDLAGEWWARQKNVPLRLFKYPRQHGKAGGPIRNRQMAENADALLLIWDGKSPGSASMLKEAERAGLHITEVVVTCTT